MLKCLDPMIPRVSTDRERESSITGGRLGEKSSNVENVAPKRLL